MAKARWPCLVDQCKVPTMPNGTKLSSTETWRETPKSVFRRLPRPREPESPKAFFKRMADQHQVAGQQMAPVAVPRNA